MFTVNEISNNHEDLRKRILNDGSMGDNINKLDEKEVLNTLNELRAT
jgi:hypothetical protein